MPPIITGKVVGSEKVVLKFRNAPARIMDAVRRTVYALGFELERIVKNDTLSGQVLHRRSGDLARSVNTKRSGNATMARASVGTNKVYGRAWQLGFHLPERVIEPKTAQSLFWPGALHPVRSVRQPARDVAARPFLTIALDRIRPKVGPTIRNAAVLAAQSP